jgi:very-short-patch-repair endonuclease
MEQKQILSLKKELEKHDEDFDCFDCFKKDLKRYLKSRLKDGTKRNLENSPELEQIKFIKEGLNKGTIIFETRRDMLERAKPLKNVIIPFDRFFISTHLHYPINNDLITIGGIFIQKFDEDNLLVSYFWSRTFEDGWAFNLFLFKKDFLKKIDYKVGSFEPLTGKLNEETNELKKFVISKLHILLSNLLDLMEKREYTTYKKYIGGNLKEKKIIFSKDVSSHKRHFWEDSGRFKIPFMSKEELFSKGYGIDELVYRDGELRIEVPYLIIGSYKIDGDLSHPQEEIENDRTISFINKRRFRQEEKMFKILRDIFPDKFIKRHDRKVLKGLELDFLIRELRLAFEYDGEQHFDKDLCENVFGSDFDELKRRDRKKDKLCRKKNVKLIRIKFDEPLNKRHILKRLRDNGISR